MAVDIRGVPPVRRAFVTGATGGIGTAVCTHLLSSGWEVIALARPGSETGTIEKLDRLQIVQCDLHDERSLTEMMRGCDTVFHLAAMVHAPGGTPDAEFQRVNVFGTRAVLDAAEASDVSVFVFFSTVAVYPESENLVDESSVVGPSTPYGKSKLEAEELVFGKKNAMRVTVLRLPVVYGPGDRGNVRRLISAIAKGRFFIPGSGDNVKTMVAVDDVALAAIHVASDARAAGKVYLVTDERAATLSEIVDAISRSLGLKRAPRSLPRPVLSVAGRLADFLSGIVGVRLPISASEVRKLASSTRYDGNRIRRELGFRSSTGLEHGIAAAVAGYRDAERQGRTSAPGTS